MCELYPEQLSTKGGIQATLGVDFFRTFQKVLAEHFASLLDCGATVESSRPLRFASLDRVWSDTSVSKNEILTIFPIRVWQARVPMHATHR